MTHTVTSPAAARPAAARLLDQALGQGQPGQVGAAAAAALIPDPLQVRGDRADADEQLRGDLAVRAALSDQGDQLSLTNKAK